LELRRPERTKIHVDSVDQNISSTVEGRRLLMAEARAWLSWWPVGSVHCSRTGSGHMGATPQPKPTIASGDNQHRRFRKSGVSNLSESNQRSGESIDTVGVTGSIPVSPTNGGPVCRGLQAFPGQSRAALEPHERWLRWMVTVRLWPRCGPTATPALPRGRRRTTSSRASRKSTPQNRDLLRILDGEQLAGNA